MLKPEKGVDGSRRRAGEDRLAESGILEGFKGRQLKKLTHRRLGPIRRGLCAVRREEVEI